MVIRFAVSPAGVVVVTAKSGGDRPDFCMLAVYGNMADALETTFISQYVSFRVSAFDESGARVAMEEEQRARDESRAYFAEVARDSSPA